jgi:4'-phosphopantetheinyl transferase
MNEGDPGPTMRDLEAGEAHVWFARPDLLTDPERVRECEAILSPAEADRAARFRFPEHAHTFRVSHALVRACLSHYWPAVPPREWTFVENAHGRPDLAPSPSVPPLVFNLSHTQGLAACAIALDAEIGVDVEWVDRRSATTEIADRFFAPAEVAQLKASPLSEQKSRFFDYWTLKESYIKARGKGLAIPLAQFAFDVSGDGPIGLWVAPELEDTPGRWQFAQWSPLPSHRAAVTVERGRRERKVTAFLAEPPGAVRSWEMPHA